MLGFHALHHAVGMWTLTAGIAISFIPTIIAFLRELGPRWVIFWLNLFLGWTGIGWLVLLIWSIVATPEGRVGRG